MVSGDRFLARATWVTVKCLSISSCMSLPSFHLLMVKISSFPTSLCQHREPVKNCWPWTPKSWHLVSVARKKSPDPSFYFCTDLFLLLNPNHSAQARSFFFCAKTPTLVHFNANRECTLKQVLKNCDFPYIIGWCTLKQVSAPQCKKQCTPKQISVHLNTRNSALRNKFQCTPKQVAWSSW
jgi:hypothetical protein